MKIITVVLSLAGLVLAACGASKAPAPAKVSSDAARAAPTPDASVDEHSPPGDYPEPKDLDQPDF